MSENGVHIHQFKDTVVPATCTQSGYTLHRCDCGYEYKDSFVPAGKHQFVLLEETKATCVQKGVRKLRCINCGEIKTFEITADHEWGDWSTQTVASCTQDGKQIHVCKHCGKVEEKTTPATGHKLTVMKDHKTKRGKTAYFCENCGETIIMTSKSKKIISKLLLFVMLPLILIASIVLSAMYYFIPNYRYNTALDAIEDGNYSIAYFSLKDCKDYKDSKELLENFEIVYGVEEQTHYDEDGDKSSTYRYERDKHGNQTLYEYRGGMVNDQTKTQYQYNKKGDITVKVNRYSNGDQNKTEYKYDKKGNLVLRVIYDRYGNLSGKVKLEYDKKGNIICETNYDENGGISDSTKYTYNKNGDMTSYTVYDVFGLQKGKTEIKYYDDGTIKQEIYYNAETGKVKSKYKWNENGHFSYHAYYNDDGDLEIELEYKYKYDEEDNITKETEYSKGEKSCTIEYEYDENGNLIGQITHYVDDDREEYEYKYKYDDDGFMTSKVCYRDGDKSYEIEYAAPIILYHPDGENTNRYYYD